MTWKDPDEGLTPGERLLRRYRSAYYKLPARERGPWTDPEELYPVSDVALASKKEGGPIIVRGTVDLLELQTRRRGD